MPNQTIQVFDTASLSSEDQVSPVVVTDTPALMTESAGGDREPSATDEFYLRGSNERGAATIQGQEMADASPPFTTEYLVGETWAEYLTSVTEDEEELN